MTLSTHYKHKIIQDHRVKVIATAHWDGRTVHLGATVHARGFVSVGEVFLDDLVPIAKSEWDAAYANTVWYNEKKAVAQRGGLT